MNINVKNSQMNCRTFDGWFLVCFIVFLAVSAFICCLPSQLVKEGICDFSTTGQIGDTIGGIMGPFIAIAAACLTFIAFWVQYKANSMQRNDIAVERFERNFYELLNLQECITNSLVLEEIVVDDPSQNFKQTGRDVFQMLYEKTEIKRMESAGLGAVRIEKSTTYHGLKELFAKDKDAFEYYTQLGEVGYLDHYFRHLYWIFKYIDKNDIMNDDEKYEYACIARSSLSQHELVVLFYNGLSDNGVENFKPLIEKYALMNNLRTDLLAKPEDFGRYNEGAYKHIC